MLANPSRRSCLSDNCISCKSVSRQWRGDRKGRMPSSTNTRHNAMPNSCHMLPTDAKKPGFSRLSHHTTFSERITPAAARRGDDSRLGRLQRGEEVATRIQHQHITLISEALAISPQAAIERIELLIHAIRLGVDRSGLGIARTAQLFSLTVGICEQHATLTVGTGANTFGQLLTLGAVLTSLTLTLGAHAIEHAAIHFLRQVDGFNAHVHNLDTQLFLRSPVQGSGHVCHQRIALAGYRLMQGALTELVTPRRFKATRPTLVGNLLHTGSRGVETLGIEHSPFGEGINHQRFLFQREETRASGVQSQQTRI